MKFKFGDIAVAAIVVVAAGVLFFTVYLKAESGPIAIIYSAGSDKNIAEIDLSKEKDGIYTYHDDVKKIDFKIEIKDGKIAMNEIDCPDKVCVHTGFISNSMMPIMCLPNKIIIAIEDPPTDGEADSAT